MDKRIAVAVAALIGIVAPAGAGAQGPTVIVGNTAPYMDQGIIPKGILAECKLPEQVIDMLQEHAKNEGITVVRGDDAVKAGKGRILIVEIVSASGGGNAWTGKSNMVSVKGRLTENGADLGNFSATRSSGGGAFGGFKGGCSILGRCAKALATDITKWLKNPTKDARLGENR